MRLAAFEACAAVAEGTFETAFVEHAYIEPEAGWALRVGDRIEIHATTQTPYMDRDEVANLMRLKPEAVRIVPTACGGGFGGKLDLSVQPLIAIAAWTLGRPVALVYTRPESMAASTKRHPARVKARFGCDAEGKLLACDVTATFDTGAYASWGPTVANRVPVHAMGPYAIPNVRTWGEAFFTNGPPAGAFRGFGVPQAAIAHEAMMDELADKLGIDRLEFRHRNALRAGDTTASGQTLAHSAGLAQCLEALRPHWQKAHAAIAAFNAKGGSHRRGIGVGCMWYGIGNTSMSNPSRMRVGLSPGGTLTLYSGALDIGQGSNTIMVQIAADAVGPAGVAVRAGDGRYRSHGRCRQDLGLAPDLRVGQGGGEGRPGFAPADPAAGQCRPRCAFYRSKAPSFPCATAPKCGPSISPRRGPLMGEGTFDPPTTPLDADGQGVPYATYAFAAQLAEVEVDIELGTVKVLRIVAAHDVGRAINPTLVEGQIHGGVAQGLGLALMEEYLPGRTENLHDYLIPTVGDVPEIECILIEDREPLGPSGAKGIGEPALVPTAPAILGAVHHATGVRVHRVPLLPHRLREAIVAREGRKEKAAMSDDISLSEAERSAGIVRCDACPVLCRIRPGRAGACDRYANENGALVRVDPLVLLAKPDLARVAFVEGSEAWRGELGKGEGAFVTGIGATTTYPDYKPAPFIVSSKHDGVDMVTVVTEGIFSYCGVKVKIDTDRYLGPEQAAVRVKGEAVGHVTTAEYGSQMLSLGGVHHLTGGSKKEGVVTCDALLALCNREAVELSIDGGSTVVVQADRPPVVNGMLEERMRVGCGSAAIGMFAPQWKDHVDEVIVVDDHITGVLSEHQGGAFLDMKPAGIRVRGRRSTPGRYFQVAEPGLGWGGTNVSDPLEIIEKIDPKQAWPGLKLLMVSTTGEHSAWFTLDHELKPQPAEMPAPVRHVVERIAENCEPALCTVLFMAGAGGSLRAGVTENPVRLTRSVRDTLTKVTLGGAPAFVWPGGGITLMVDVARMPEKSFGYVPTPALVAPIEFTLRADDYAALGGYASRAVTLEDVLAHHKVRIE